MPMITKGESSAFDLLMASTVLPLLILDILLAKVVRLNAGQEFRTALGLSVGSPGVWILAGAYAYCRWRGMTRMADVSQALAWTLLVAPTISFLIPVAGRTPYPLVDGALASLDARMHFHTVDIVRVIGRFPQARHALALAYNVLWVMVVAALLIPTIGGRALDTRRYLFAVLIAAIMTALLFAVWPAAGPWTVQNFSPNADQAEVVGALASLKSGLPLDEGVRTAVVAFPSFHVILAVLSVIALWNTRWVRWFAVVFGGMICVSTLTTGWHYLIDVIAGLVVTYVAQQIACFVLSPAAAKGKVADFVAPESSEAFLSST